MDYNKILKKDRYSDMNRDAWQEDDFREMEIDVEATMRDTVKKLAQRHRWTVSDQECENVADRLTDLLMNGDFFGEMMA